MRRSINWASTSRRKTITKRSSSSATRRPDCGRKRLAWRTLRSLLRSSKALLTTKATPRNRNDHPSHTFHQRPARQLGGLRSTDRERAARQGHLPARRKHVGTKDHGDAQRSRRAFVDDDLRRL